MFTEMADLDKLEKNLMVDLTNKVRQLIERHQALSSEKHQLTERIGKLEFELNQLRHENSELQRKYENLKLTKLLHASDDESKEAKGRIQKLVREIDKCIALLNQ
jgi:uncharacterized coiled-coil DUF342 family protein